MKKQSENSLQTISKIQVENLTTANDTLDISFNQSGRKLFTTVDMWNIHRNAKSSFSKRHSF